MLTLAHPLPPTFARAPWGSDVGLRDTSPSMSFKKDDALSDSSAGGLSFFLSTSRHAELTCVLPCSGRLLLAGQQVAFQTFFGKLTRRVLTDVHQQRCLSFKKPERSQRRPSARKQASLRRVSLLRVLNRLDASSFQTQMPSMPSVA